MLHLPHFDSRRLITIHLCEIYLKAIDDIKMVRSGCIDKTLQVNMGKGYGYQIWAAKTLRDSI